jgi:hypothetical protein
MLIKAKAFQPVTIVAYRARKETETWREVTLEVEIPEIEGSKAPLAVSIASTKGSEPRMLRIGSDGYLEPMGRRGGTEHPSEWHFASWKDTNLRAATPDLWSLLNHRDRQTMLSEVQLYALHAGRERTVSVDERATTQYSDWLSRNLVVVDGVIHAPVLPPLISSHDRFGHNLLTTTNVVDPSPAGHDYFFDGYTHVDAWPETGEGIPEHAILDRDAVAGFDLVDWKLRQGSVSLVNRMSETGKDFRPHLSRLSSDAIAAFAVLRDLLLRNASFEELLDAALSFAEASDDAVRPVVSAACVDRLRNGFKEHKGELPAP